MHVIAIDIGTQGTKAALIDETYNIILTEFIPSEIVMDEDGAIYQNPQSILESVEDAIRLIIKKTDKNIDAICIDSQMAGVMGIDDNFNAVTYYDSWLDTRCKEFAALIKEKANDRVVELTGAPVTCAHAAKILWWKHTHMDIYDKVSKFVMPHVYVAGKIANLSSKDAYIDYTCIQYSGFADNYNKKWSTELTELFGVSIEKLPNIISPFEIIGNVSLAFARKTGLKHTTAVIAGSGDTASSIFGTGVSESGLLLDCAGTASVLCSVSNDYSPDISNDTMTLMRSPMDGSWYPLAYINGGGLCIRWFKENFTGDEPIDYSVLEDEASKINPGSDGLIFVPHFCGRVLPSVPSMRGSFIGLTHNHTRAHMYRSIMEGIAYEYKYYLDTMKKLFPDYDYNLMYAMGGGAKSKLFLQIKADVMGVNVKRFVSEDTSLLGNASIAFSALGIIDSYSKLQSIVNTTDTIHYNPENHNIYKQYAAKYVDFLDYIKNFYEER